jgi:hypothetical protein
MSGPIPIRGKPGLTPSPSSYSVFCVNFAWLGRPTNQVAASTARPAANRHAAWLPSHPDDQAGKSGVPAPRSWILRGAGLALADVAGTAVMTASASWTPEPTT